MSNTRYAKPGSEPSDERYASDPLLSRGLKAGDVIRRCATLSDPRFIELALFLQYLSNQPGSLEKLATDLLAAFPDRLGTPSMIRYGMRPGGILNADQVRATRREAPFTNDAFLLKGERSIDGDGFPNFGAFLGNGPRHEESIDDYKNRRESEERAEAMKDEREKRASEELPLAYPVSAFLEICRQHFLRDAPDIFHQFCIVPAFAPARVSLDCFHDLMGSLIEYMNLWEKKVWDGFVITEVGAKVREALDYSEDQRCLSLVEGFARTGKSFVAEAWVKARPGKRRIVSLSEATSDKEFFREINRALYATAGYGLKTNELRERGTGILREGHLTLVIDEGHFLWPQRNLREASPRRIEWVRASLVNYSVPVAIISTHQFTKSQQQLEKHSNWSSEQFIGRLAFCAKLPARLKRGDIEAVARFHLPEAEERTIDFLVNYVVASKKHLASIEHGVRAARHEAKKHGRLTVTYDDVMVGFDNTVIPTDANLANAAQTAETRAARRRKGGSPFFETMLPEPPESIPERDSGSGLVVKLDRKDKRSDQASLSKT